MRGVVVRHGDGGKPRDDGAGRGRGRIAEQSGTASVGVRVWGSGLWASEKREASAPSEFLSVCASKKTCCG
jgi:hypothetical protein